MSSPESSRRYPTWKEILPMIGGSIAVSVGVSWALTTRSLDMIRDYVENKHSSQKAYIDNEDSSLIEMDRVTNQRINAWVESGVIHRHRIEPEGGVETELCSDEPESGCMG